MKETAPKGEHDGIFREAIEYLLRTDPPRGLQWVWVAACRGLEVRLAERGAHRVGVVRAVLRDLRAVGIFSEVNERDLERLLHSEFAKYNATGGWDGWREREVAEEAKRQAREGAQ